MTEKFWAKLTEKGRKHSIINKVQGKKSCYKRYQWNPKDNLRKPIMPKYDKSGKNAKISRPAKIK